MNLVKLIKWALKNKTSVYKKNTHCVNITIYYKTITGH